MRRAIILALILVLVITLIVLGFSYFVLPILPPHINNFLIIFFVALSTVIGVLAGFPEIVKLFSKGIAEQDKKRKIQVELDATVRKYLELAQKSFLHLKFRGLPRERAKEPPPELLQVYVNLSMQTGEQTDSHTRKGKGTEDALPEGGFSDAISKTPINLAQAFQQSHKLAIIGVAGSGKSTLLQ